MTADHGMLAYYAARAPHYDDVYTVPERQADLRWLTQFIPRVFTARHVLDVAAGTGFWTAGIAREASSVLAVDASAEPLARLEARALGDHVQTALHDAYALDTLGGFDAAFVGFWFSHVPRARRRAFCRGLDAALAPGSPVVFVDNLPGACQPINRVDDVGDGWHTRTLPDGSEHQVLKNFPRPDEMLDALEGLASHTVWRELEHFWVFQYRTGACHVPPL
ncbi:MAG: methyltransferase domain-containing protein [Pseudomonadota bacterium]